MKSNYNPKEIEAKWQKMWDEARLHETEVKSGKPKYYALETFPYPSAAGLHVGHPVGYTAEDIQVRYQRMNGKNVLYAMGWDAFGLPTENYAIKVGKRPQVVATENIANFKKQVKMFGFSYDWTREINTSSPEYYRWTQWIFIQMFKKGLAYRRYAPVNWCDSCKTVLAREQVEDGKCERCKNIVIQKDMEQWFFKITEYAEELLSGLENLDWPSSTKEGQRNWIGKSEGSIIGFTLAGTTTVIDVFTTRPDTLSGVTYLVLAPEHPLVATLDIKNREAVRAYQEMTSKKSEMERTHLNKEKTGVLLEGVTVNHPMTGEALPIWIADYVIATYGTGAVMAVPALDERDQEFAKVYSLPVKEVVMTGKEDEYGKKMVSYRLRDWLVSRQRYWGAPIPMIWCKDCGAVPVPENQLPVLLPDIVDFTPTGEPPLASSPEFQKIACPQCGRDDARRDFETMDTFVDSSWYFLRYPSAHQNEAAFIKQDVDAFMPVDLYVIGAEHIVLHLLYARFFTKVFADMGLCTVREPFARMRHVGLVLGTDGQKMSKSRGNVVNPDEIVAQFGADALRMYLMFMAPLEDAKPWSTENILGVSRFLEKVWRVGEKVDPRLREDDREDSAVTRIMHQTVKKVGEDIVGLQYNTAIAQMMIAVNAMTVAPSVARTDYEMLLKVLHPFAPHITEELWHELGNTTFLQHESWPMYDAARLVAETFELVIQVNGKIRQRVQAATGSDDETLKALALSDEKIIQELAGREPKKVIVIQNRLVNIVL